MLKLETIDISIDKWTEEKERYARAHAEETQTKESGISIPTLPFFFRFSQKPHPTSFRRNTLLTLQRILQL